MTTETGEGGGGRGDRRVIKTYHVKTLGRQRAVSTDDDTRHRGGLSGGSQTVTM